MDERKKELTAEDVGDVRRGRRAALRKLGLFGLAAYAAPALMSLSDAEAASRSRSNNKKRRKKKNRKKNRSRSVSRSRSRSND